ncbi:hypothetical protein RSAG8_00425, partial [Rhizoctonia solani AG-8 WAC10335]
MLRMVIYGALGCGTRCKLKANHICPPPA